MGYLHIENLYKNQDILMFKECYAMEKIHGTSAHIQIFGDAEGCFNYFSGGESYDRFKSLFNEKQLSVKVKELGIKETLIIYGEAYGGKQQGMSGTYGKELKFIAFEVKIGDYWLDVPKAEYIVKQLGLDFVWYVKTSTDINKLDEIKNLPSEQAKRNGILEPKKMEGIVLRPLIEITKNNGDRIIAKYKLDEFKETKTERIVSEEKLKILENAKDISSEWVTPMRLNHILGKIENPDIAMTSNIIKLMVEDIKREANNEIVWNKDVEKIISKDTAIMFKQRLQNILKGE